MKNWFLSFLLFAGFQLPAQQRPFRFAFVSDTHIGSPNGSAEEDLRRTVRDINTQPDIAFVVLTGDITEMGTNEELRLARQILDSLRVPWYIIPGNHDTGWSESGGDMFTRVFGSDKFSFEYAGVRFMGCASGPYVRMSDGHVPRDAVNWLENEVKKADPRQPLIFFNHYPVDEGLDNWYELTDRLRLLNTQAILCGHGHANKAMNFEDIPGVMGRSNLRAKAAEGGYNLVDIRPDSLVFTERKPISRQEKKWTAIAAEKRLYQTGKKFKRPDYAVNDSFSTVRRRWDFADKANIISTPAVSAGRAYVGNQLGEMKALSLLTGKSVWTYKAGGPVFSSPAIAGPALIFGGADGYIYCLDTARGKLRWKVKTGAAVLGSPLINGDTVFIGGSDHSFRALFHKNGKQIWLFNGLEGPVVSKPLLTAGLLVFGAWDRHLYAIHSSDGTLRWKWNNGSSVRNFSPASCIPVTAKGLVYIMAPDRYTTAISLSDGQTAWRLKDAGVRESIGISTDGNFIYGKTMQDTVVAYATGVDTRSFAWKMHAGFGYEHVPSMLMEKDGLMYFGTRSGTVYAIDPQSRTRRWVHKIDNSMMNTVLPLGKGGLLVTTMDGRVVLLEEK